MALIISITSLIILFVMLYRLLVEKNSKKIVMAASIVGVLFMVCTLFAFVSNKVSFITGMVVVFVGCLMYFLAYTPKEKRPSLSQLIFNVSIMMVGFFIILVTSIVYLITYSI